MTQKPTSHSSKQSSFTIDNFLIEKTIGEGTFGKVKLGVHLPTGEKVAIKILEKDKIQDNEDLERITREIKFLKILKHPNIIKIFQIIEDKKNYYIIMEYAKNGELFTHIVNNKRLSENEAIILYSQLIQALSFIHKHNIVHRDIKPENLLLKHNNILAIIDFGLSNQYKDNKTLNTPCGSPCYAAPEMILGRKYNGLNVDIWSSGIVLYAMVCGYLPFEDKNNDKLYKKILNGHFEMPDRLSPECKDLIKRILIVNPKKRIQLEDIIAHPFLQKGMEWYKETFNDKYFPTSSNEVNYDIIDKTINEMVGYDVDREIVEKYIINNKHNSITTTYYLLLDKEHQHQLCIRDDDDTNNNNDNNDNVNNNDKKVSSYDINESYCSNSNNNNNNASTSYTNVIPAKKQKHAKDKELKDKIKNIQINISLSPINTPSPITLFPSNRNNTSISTSTSTTRKFRDYSVTIPSNKPISNTKFYYNLHTVHSKSNNSPLQIKSQRQRDPSLEVSNIIKNHNNNSSNHFLINTPCIITPLNRKIIQKLPAHNRNKNNNNNLIATNLSSNSNKTVHITSTNMKSNHNSFSSNSKKQIDTSITYDNTNIFLKSIEHNKKRQYKLNTHNCNNNSTIHNKLVYIPSNTINLMEDEQDGVNSLNECCSNGNSASNIKRGTSSSFMMKSSSNDNNRSFSQKNKSRIKNNVINSHKNTSSLNYYSNNNSNNKNSNNNNNSSNSNRLNKRGLIGQKGSLSGGKDFSPSSRCSSNNKNITLLKLNDNDGNTNSCNGNSVCYNYNRQGATTPNNSSAISKKYTFKKQIATHHKKPAVIDIDITTTTNNNNNGVSTLNTNAYKKTSTLSLKANKPKQQSNTARNNTNSNNINKRTDIRIHGFVDLSQNKTTSKNSTTTTNNSNNSNTTASSKTKPQNSNSGTNIYNVSSSSKRKMSTTSIDGDISANTTNTNTNKDTSSSSSTPTSSNTTKQQSSNSFCLCTTTSSHDEVIKQLTILANTNNYVLSNINDSTTTRYICELNSNSICIEISKVGMNNVLKLYHVNGDEQITKEIIKNVIVNIGF